MRIKHTITIELGESVNIALDKILHLCGLAPASAAKDRMREDQMAQIQKGAVEEWAAGVRARAEERRQPSSEEVRDTVLAHVAKRHDLDPVIWKAENEQSTRLEMSPPLTEQEQIAGVMTAVAGVAEQQISAPTQQELPLEPAGTLQPLVVPLGMSFEAEWQIRKAARIANLGQSGKTKRKSREPVWPGSEFERFEPPICGEVVGVPVELKTGKVWIWPNILDIDLTGRRSTAPCVAVAKAETMHPIRLNWPILKNQTVNRLQTFVRSDELEILWLDIEAKLSKTTPEHQASMRARWAEIQIDLERAEKNFAAWTIVRVAKTVQPEGCRPLTPRHLDMPQDAPWFVKFGDTGPGLTFQEFWKASTSCRYTENQFKVILNALGMLKKNTTHEGAPRCRDVAPYAYKQGWAVKIVREAEMDVGPASQPTTSPRNLRLEVYWLPKALEYLLNNAQAIDEMAVRREIHPQDVPPLPPLAILGKINPETKSL